MVERMIELCVAFALCAEPLEISARRKTWCPSGTYLKYPNRKRLRCARITKPIIRKAKRKQVALPHMFMFESIEPSTVRQVRVIIYKDNAHTFEQRWRGE